MSVPVNYITPDALVNEWITDNEYTGKIKEDLFRRWVNRATGLIAPSVDSLVFRVGLIDVHNRVGQAPPYTRSIILAGCVSDFRQSWNREEMTKWVYDALGTDCEVEVHVNCPSCKQSKCDCSSPIIELEMDQIYREQRPYLTHVNYHNFVGYVAAETDGLPRMSMNPRFHIMKPQVSDMAFWNTEYYLGVCQSLGPALDGAYTFRLDDGKFITDLQEGQVLISYLAERRTPEGYLLVPRVPVVIEAILAYIDMKVQERLYKFGGNQTDRLHWYDAKNEWKEKWGTAKTKLVFPSAEHWLEIINKHWKLSPDRYHYGRASS